MATITIPQSEVVTCRKNLRVLYADDMKELRDVMRISLTREGHAIECVVDGVTALERLRVDPAFDLLITDHHMPLLNGLELVEQVRTLPFQGKIMVFSSELSPKVATAYREFGVARILYKPVYPSVLRQGLAELFPEARPAAE